MKKFLSDNKLSLGLMALLVLITGCIELTPLKEVVKDTIESNSLTTTRVEATVDSVEWYWPQRDQNCPEILRALYLSSTQTLDIAIYSLTYPSIIQAIKDAKSRGVLVRVLSDKTQSAGVTQKQAINNLLGVGIPVRINKHSGLMHLKVSIIDNSILTTGSFNYSKNAQENNDEVLVVIKSSEMVKDFSKEFSRLWNSTGFVDAEMSY
jgi:phosphatidylserine/phosphatidylglycerophosphate/cardiolipin synthase-like enzyme